MSKFTSAVLLILMLLFVVGCEQAREDGLESAPPSQPGNYVFPTSTVKATATADVPNLEYVITSRTTERREYKNTDTNREFTVEYTIENRVYTLPNGQNWVCLVTYEAQPDTSRSNNLLYDQECDFVP